jgi:hypothetical protein
MAKMTKKTTAKKPSAKQTKPLKKATTARIKPELVTAKLTPIKTKTPATKRPPLTPSIPHQVIDEVISDLIAVKNNLDAYAAWPKSLWLFGQEFALCANSTH